MKRKRRTRRKLKVGRIILALFILVLIVIGIYFVIFKINDDRDLPISDPIATDKKKETKKKDEKYELSLVMVGDNLIHSSVYNDASKNAGYDGYDFKPMYTYIKDIVKKYDLAYYNQETILGGSELGLSDYPTFNSPYEVGDAMIDAGFNLVSLATNHTLDSGVKAIENSCKYWNSHAEEVLSAGSYCSEEERNEIKIKEKNNITYTMLSYTYGTNGIAIPSGKEYLVNVWPMDYNADYGVGFEGYKTQVKKDVEAVRNKVDLLIVAMHWGVEYTHIPTSYQKEAAEYLASLGVDIIIGAHPHVVQPVTWIDDTLVIYSLGNFISAQYQDNPGWCTDYQCMVGLMSSVEITKEVKGGETTITLSDVNNDLLYTYYNNYRNFKVVPFSSSDIYDYNSDANRIYNKYSAVIKNMDEEIPVIAIG